MLPSALLPLLLLAAASAWEAGGDALCESQVLDEPVAEAAVPGAARRDARAGARAAAAGDAGADPGARARAVLRAHPRLAAVALVREGGAGGSALALRAADGGVEAIVERSPADADADTDANATAAAAAFWRAAANRSDDGWTPRLRDCFLSRGRWFFGLAMPLQEDYRGTAAVFLPVTELLPCNTSVGAGNACDADSTVCVPEALDHRGYVCRCRPGYWRDVLDSEIIEDFSLREIRGDAESCVRCGEGGGGCGARSDPLLRAAVLSVQLLCVSLTVALAAVVFRQRKCKTIATGMWTILETILLGILFLYSTVIVRFFEPSVEQCLVEPWIRELGFVICYGAIILKLYRILIEFRTRKAHRWVVRDKDLLKYLLGMVIVVLGYMAAWTASNLNFIQENYSILTVGHTVDGMHFIACKALWWDYVTETGEMMILLFGIHLSYACRNATTQFQERRYLCIAITVEAVVSGAFYILRVLFHDTLHPDYAYLAYFVRSQLTSTSVILLIFMPKLWYQQRGTRHYLPQELSTRAPLDAFKPQDGATGNNSDVEVGEINLADMNPEDIRAELKRLYTQLEVLKNKTIRADNPHISKRRGGRKVAHRRFSLQKKGSREKALHHRHQRCSMRHPPSDSGGGGGGGEGGGEGEVSRTPEDSVCSNEGPSAIYNDGPSTYSDVGTPNVSFRVSHRQ